MPAATKPFSFWFHLPLSFFPSFLFPNLSLLTMGPLCGLSFPAIPGGAHGPRPPAEVRKPYPSFRTSPGLTLKQGKIENRKKLGG
ncbi:hypothetical protein BDV24DRAFT_123255 [Aspergillus arachidicola]|uniref:Secreted protein n=1 Tax=Aspergillus arachidicola TaxID=656916 RepID=A0A5N6YME8_9EURO|nr:hypothetical protein BDV24DRAFT_123255 [Aspergillus arachidicola]